jgi:hypothetical protein
LIEEAREPSLVPGEAARVGSTLGRGLTRVSGSGSTSIAAVRAGFCLQRDAIVGKRDHNSQRGAKA